MSVLPSRFTPGSELRMSWFSAAVMVCGRGRTGHRRQRGENKRPSFHRLCLLFVRCRRLVLGA